MIGQIVLPTVFDIRRLPHLLARALLHSAPNLVEVLEILGTLEKGLHKPLLVNNIANRIVLCDCPQIDVQARDQPTIAIDIELHTSLLVYL